MGPQIYTPVMNLIEQPVQIGQLSMMCPPIGLEEHSEEGQNIKLTYLSNNHRKDLLWKPLIRMFRRFLKKDALTLDTYEGIRAECLTKQGLLFCRALGIPDELGMEPRNQMAVLLMVSSHRIVWRKSLIPICKEMMQPFIKEIWPLFFKIFNETSHKYRLLFFSEPIIHVLWNKFRHSMSHEIKQYLHKVSKNTSSTLSQKHTFVNDICKIEINTNCHIMP